MGSAIEELFFDDARKFIDFLRLSSEQWKWGGDVNWIFRGHSNWAFDLLPTLYRPNITADPLYSRHHAFYSGILPNGSRERQALMGKIASEYPRIFESLVVTNVENKMLRDFVWKGNKIGLPIPEMEKVLVPM